MIQVAIPDNIATVTMPVICTSIWLPIVAPSAKPNPPKLSLAKTATSKVPIIPPTPWTAKTSSESSILQVVRIQVANHWQTKPATSPMTTAPIGPTKPDAGVIEARPAIVPVTMPTTLGFPNFIHSIKAHVSEATAADI